MLKRLFTLMLTSMAVVREKEIGAQEPIIVTPIMPLEFILGKTVAGPEIRRSAAARRPRLPGPDAAHRAAGRSRAV